MLRKRDIRGTLLLAAVSLCMSLSHTLLAQGQRQQLQYTVGRDPRSVAVADFNLDGKDDLAVANLGSNDVSILLQEEVPDEKGIFRFRRAVAYPAGAGPIS